MHENLEELAAIIELLDRTEFTDFLFEKDGLYLRVLRGGTIPAAAAAPAPPAPAPPAPTTPAPAPPAPAAPSPANAPPSSSPSPARAPAHTPSPPTAPAPDRPEGSSTEPEEDETLVKAPMLGTFYTRPKPGEPPFVQPGDTVEAGDTVCIIEVMKLMNSVSAEVSGTVTRVLVDDGELVEFDQPLIAVRPTS